MKKHKSCGYSLSFLFIAFSLATFVSLCLSGCASYVKTVPLPARKAPAVFKSRNQVLAGLKKNYGGFKGLSGRLKFFVNIKGLYYEQAGLYKFVKGRYMQFTILDIYGNVLFYVKVFEKGNRVVFFYPALKKVKYINFDKKYSGKLLNYERLFKAFKIFLNIDGLEKIKKAAVFYNTDKGFFFGYRKNYGHLGEAADAGRYYICVSRNYLIRKITIVRHKKIIETATFKNYILKDKTMVPLKISVDDYLYNVKINVELSKKSSLIY